MRGRFGNGGRTLKVVVRILAVAALSWLTACAGAGRSGGVLRIDSAPAVDAAARVAERSGQRYFFEGPTPGKITLVAPPEATADEVHELFRRALEAQGYEVAVTGRTSRVLLRPPALPPPPPAAAVKIPEGRAKQASPADELVAAAAKGDVEAVRRALAGGVDPNAATQGGRALPVAAGKGHLDVVKALVEAGALVNLADGGQKPATPLAAAVSRNREEVARYLLSQGADPEPANLGGFGTLRSAVENASLPLVKLLVEAGANVNAWGEGGERPLHAAARAGKADVVRYLLDRGAHPDGGAVRTPSGIALTPLALAVAGGHREVSGILVERGASLDRALLACAAQGTGSCVEELLARGARVEALDPEGATPLLVAAAHGKADVVSALLSRGAKLAARDPGGRTALHRAAEPKDVLAARLLLDAGAEVEATDGEGATAVQAASDTGTLEMLRLLLGRGADPNRRDAAGNTSLHLAARAGRAEVAKALLEAGARPGLVNHAGELPGDLVPAKVRDNFPELHATAKEEPPASPGGRRISVEAFVSAAKKGELATLRQYLSEGGNPSVVIRQSPGDRWSTAVGTAVAEGKLQALQLLLEAGAWPNPRVVVSSLDYDALGRAAALARWQIARLLLEKGAEAPPLVSRGGVVSTLVPFCQWGDLDLVRAAVERGADVNAPGSSVEGRLPIQAAAATGRVETVRYLLEKGAAPDGRGGQGQARVTALGLALAGGHLEAAEPLLGAGANVRRAILGVSSLEQGALEAVQYLWKLQPAPEARDGAGLTPLLLAARAGNRELVAFLLEQSADPKARDAGGRTALHLVAKRNALLVRLLVAAGCPLEGLDAEGKTPLLVASANRDLAENVRELLQAGASLAAADPQGNTALHLAARAGASDTIRLLLTAGADPSRTNKAGKTPLEIGDGQAARAFQKTAVLGPKPPERAAPAPQEPASKPDPLRAALAKEAQEALAREGAARHLSGRLALRFPVDSAGRCGGPPSLDLARSEVWAVDGDRAGLPERLGALVQGLGKAFPECAAATSAPAGQVPAAREVTVHALLPAPALPSGGSSRAAEVPGAAPPTGTK